MNIGGTIIRREKVSSTNSVASALLSTQKIEEGTVIITDEQFKGKGHGSNEWESEPGKNLTFSVILYPGFLEPGKQFYLSKIISLAITDTLGEYCDELSIKWPNDIYVRDDKIAGILIENSISGNTIESTIAGIGININQTDFISDAPNPVSLKTITGTDHAHDVILNQFFKECNKWYNVLEKSEFDNIDNSYREILYMADKEGSFISSGKRFSGIIRGVDSFGRLLIEVQGGNIRIFAHMEVEIIR